MTRDQGDLLDAGAAAKRTALLLRDARAALRRVDTSGGPRRSPWRMTPCR